MTVSYRTNVLSLSIADNLSRSNNRLSQVFEQLSSGQRINRVSDDAAGLALSENLDVKRVVSNRASRNANDATSLLQIADSALDSVGSLMTRMAELAEQASNGTLSTTQRRSLATEYQALDAEIRRIGASTKFNGVSLLEGERSAIATGNTFDLLNQSSPQAFSADGRYFTYLDSTNKIVQFDQVTATTTTIATGAATRAPVSSADGSVVIYQSGNDLYRWDKDTQLSQKITNAQGAETYAGLSISADGGFVAFSALTQYVHGDDVSSAGATSSRRIYRLDLGSGTISKIDTVVAGGLTSFQISANGQNIVIANNQNLTGGNADANYEVFTANFESSTPSYTQVTSTTAGNIITARIGDNGKIFFITNQNLGGQNSGLKHNVFSYDPGSSSFTNLTNNTSNSTFGALTASSDGTAVFFSTAANLTGENTSGYIQLYRSEFSGTITQLSNLTDPEAHITSLSTISADGSTALWQISDGILIPVFNEIAEFRPAAKTIEVELGSGATGKVSISLTALRTALEGLGGFAISSESGARGALAKVRENIDALGNARGVIGAGLSRLEHSTRLLQTVSEEYNAANARIMDIDFAEATANMVREQILQQAGTALLAQANLQPQISLALLEAS